MQVQDSKKDLADLVLGAHDKQDDGRKLKNLEVCCPVDAVLLALTPILAASKPCLMVKLNGLSGQGESMIRISDNICGWFR